jgi:prephenate dehydratase
MVSTRAARYAYLGPEGTFTETALLQVPGAQEAERVPVASVDAALDAVRDGSADFAMVPIENSVEGGVTATIDALAAGKPLVVVREALVPVTLHLVGRPGVSLAEVTRVTSHVQGLAQCRLWLHEHLPNATLIPALSTAGAAAGLLEDGVLYDAALCAPIAASRYGLPVLAQDVGDNASAVTRFVLVSQPGPPPAPTGSDKTTLAAYLATNNPGALLEILEQFAVRGINLTRLESRPTGDELGRYYMSIDAEGHVTDARLAEALRGLHRVCAAVRFLGSYPRADRGEPIVRPEHSQEAFAQADAWFSRLLAGDWSG